MKLRRHEVCPIHNSRFCCGRERLAKNRARWAAIQKIEDPRHPRGYRERRSPAEMCRLLRIKIREQHGRCAICQREFRHFDDAVPDHIEPKGMGGAWRDDHPDNIQAAHRHCNLKKGSRRTPRRG